MHTVSDTENRIRMINWPDDSTKADWESGVYMEGATEPWTQQVVASLLVARQKRGLRVLELGSFKGHTTVWLAKALESMGGGTLDTVELDPARSQVTYARLDQLAPVDVFWDTVCQDSLAFLHITAPGSYDFIWVDDSHEVAHVANELEMLLRPTQPELSIVASGGLVLMHDVVGPHGLGAVCKRFGGIILDFPKLGTDGGLGIIQSPDNVTFHHPV